MTGVCEDTGKRMKKAIQPVFSKMIFLFGAHFFTEDFPGLF